MKLTRLFNDFFNSEKAGGLLLIICTGVSLVVANSMFGPAYLEVWSHDYAGHSLQHWINDGLMTIFFLLIGLELERELYAGELKEVRHAMLPVFGALGGMLVPALLYYAFNAGTATQAGIGIPMATDIAFAIGILSLLGKRVPSSLKVFLTALAVIDDLGAILVIALFYTGTIEWINLSLAGFVFLLLLVFNRLKIHFLPLYLAGGILMWFFMLHSGIHATITGVLLAFAIPFGDGSERSPSSRLQHFLHRPVAFFILPLFALANTAIMLGDGWFRGLTEPGSLGIFAGLFLGKPAGILLFVMAGVAFGWFSLPAEITWKHILGVGFLGGIGFTMSIFISMLAYDQAPLIDMAKISVLLTSVFAGMTGLFWLAGSLRRSMR